MLEEWTPGPGASPGSASDSPASTESGADPRPEEIPDPRKVSSPGGIAREAPRSSGRTGTPPGKRFGLQRGKGRKNMRSKNQNFFAASPIG